MAARILALLRLRAYSMCTSVSGATLPSLMRVLTILRTWCRERMAMGLRTALVRGLPRSTTPFLSGFASG